MVLFSLSLLFASLFLSLSGSSIFISSASSVSTFSFTLFSSVLFSSNSTSTFFSSSSLSTFLASFLIVTIGILAYKAGAPTVPSSFILFVSLTSIAFSSISMYFLITSIISCFIISKKSADTFALSCINTRCSLSLAVSFDFESIPLSFFLSFLKKFTMFSNIYFPPIAIYFRLNTFFNLLKNPFSSLGIVTSMFSPKILLAASTYALPDGAFLLVTTGSPLFV